MNQLHPLDLVKQLKRDAETEMDAKKSAQLIEAADTIIYLITLLELCSNYIHDNNEYGFDPRFLRAIREIFPDPGA